MKKHSPKLSQREVLNELAQALQEKHGRRVSRRLIMDVLDVYGDLLTRSLNDPQAHPECIPISGLGWFFVQERQARMQCNPRTGDRQRACPRRVLAFRPSRKYATILR